MQKNNMLSEASHTKERLFHIAEKAGVYFTVRTEPSGIIRLILDFVGTSFFQWHQVWCSQGGDLGVTSYNLVQVCGLVAR